jgi:SAM-dependent methyltransferase
LRAERRSHLLAAGAALGPGVKALEIGCGTGLFTELLARSGATIVAVDISEDLLDRARARRLPADRITFVCAQFESMTIKGGFDAVVGSSVLHHLDARNALRAMARLLKPGGRLSFAEPNLLNPQVFLERHPPFFLKKHFEYVSPDEVAFLRGPLRVALESSGFENVSITPFDWLHPATPPALIKMVRGAGAVLERIPLAREFAGSLAIRGRRAVGPEPE